jgi:hypothetical protein
VKEVEDEKEQEKEEEEEEEANIDERRRGNLVFNKEDLTSSPKQQLFIPYPPHISIPIQPHKQLLRVHGYPLTIQRPVASSV